MQIIENTRDIENYFVERGEIIGEPDTKKPAK